MPILALDTSTKHGSVALVHAGWALAIHEDDSGDHSSHLIAAIDDVLRRAGLSARELDAIAVGVGPGSFTGLRIGMSTAKGLAFALDVPLWGVSSLAAIAAGTDAADARKITRLAVITDAHRREIFAGLFSAGGGVELAGERVLKPANLSATLGEMGASPADTALVGAGVELYPEAVAASGYGAVIGPLTPSALDIARVAMREQPADGRVSATPVYLRPSEAEIRFPDGNPGGTFAPRPVASDPRSDVKPKQSDDK